MPAIASSTSWPIVGCLAWDLRCGQRGFGRYPEDVQRAVFVRIFGIGSLSPLGVEPRVLLLEGVGDVLEEDQPEHDVLVLGGIHAAAQRVGHPPELGLVTDGGGGAVRGCSSLVRIGHIGPHSVTPARK
jgi:hypothetical protein